MRIQELPILKSISIICVMLLCSVDAFSQNPSVLRGKIKANTDDVEKIHVINLNLEKGTVTNKQGEFQIMANEDDSLYISSVQFENKSLVVTREMINSGSLEIEVQDKMNELAEVVIDDIKLSGHLASDLTKISVTDVETKNRLQNNLNEFIAKDRKLNPYNQLNPMGGIRVDKIAGAVIEKLSKKTKAPKTYTSKELANKSIEIVGREFFREDLSLNENEICNFLYFCTEDTRFRHLVINNNAFVLIEYFQSRIDDFKERRGTALNAGEQIPG